MYIALLSLVQNRKFQCLLYREFPEFFKTHLTFISRFIFKASRSLWTKRQVLLWEAVAHLRNSVLPWELRRLGNTSSIKTLKHGENWIAIKEKYYYLCVYLAIAKKQKSALNVLLLAPTFVKKLAPEFANRPAKN